MEKTAKISDCGCHRYELSRIWDDTKPLVLFIMLNPSTADAEKDDPTIRRCINFAKSWGYGGLMVGNLFSLRSSDPKQLKPFTTETDYYHNDQNHQSITKMYWLCAKTICAWGNPPIAVQNYPSFGFLLHYLALTKSGQPRHPLYLKNDLQPQFLTFKQKMDILT